jgi:uncharacterized protein (DUF58 family)
MRNFVPFLLILLLISALLRLDFFFTIAYLFFAVYLLSRLWTRHTVNHLRVQRQFTDRAFPGEPVTVTLTVQNGSRLPIPWLEVNESLPVELVAPPLFRRVLSLDPHERHPLHYTLHCRRRGYYRVGPLTMRSGDLFGLEPYVHARTEPDHIIVYPRVVPLQQLDLPTRSPLVAMPAQARLFEDPARIMGVRDYQRGDSLRRIHWTATATTGRLLVKRYQPSIARETWICLDLDEADYARRQRYTATELAIVVAASIANHIVVREGLSAGLVTEGNDPLSEQDPPVPRHFHLPPRSERSHLMSLLEILARVQITSGTCFADLLRRESAKFSWGATLSIVTGRESEELFDTLVALRQAGFAASLILVQPVHPSAELQKRADLLGVPIHRVWAISTMEQDLEIWR